MSNVRARLSTLLATRKVVEVKDCVHFCAYRYGRGEINPYEQYAIGLAGGRPLENVRREFVDYLRHFRPRHLGEALGVSLGREYPLWHLPWRTTALATASTGWLEGAEDVVDVMTYFTSKGIPRKALEREYAWHEVAFDAIRAHGYQPRRYSYITVRELRGSHSAYLVTDGNHRLSAVSALGASTVAVKQTLGTTVNRDDAARWPLVRAGMVDMDDALRIFDAYLDGHSAPARSEVPANLF